MMRNTEQSTLEGYGLSSEYDRLKRVLLARPQYFDLVPINVVAAGNIENGLQPNKAQALAEHEAFAQAIASKGAEVVYADLVPNLPDQVFTRDLGVMTPKGLLLGSFHYPSRQGETDTALESLGEDIPLWRNVSVHPGHTFEGGDFVYIDNHTVALGLGARTNAAAVAYIKAQMAEQGIEVLHVPIPDECLHLDMTLSIVSEKVAVVVPEALPESLLKVLRNKRFNLVEVPYEGVFKTHGNLVAIDNGVVVSPASSVATNRALRALGIEVLDVDLHHLLMGGGGCHCMSFPIWRQA